jgi:WD40 repeat protein
MNTKTNFSRYVLKALLCMVLINLTITVCTYTTLTSSTQSYNQQKYAPLIAQHQENNFENTLSAKTMVRNQFEQYNISTEKITLEPIHEELIHQKPSKNALLNDFHQQKKIIDEKYEKLINNATPIKPLIGSTGFPPYLSPDGKKLVSQDDNTLKLWDTTTCTCLQTLHDECGHDLDIVFLPDQKTLAVKSNSYRTGSSILLWDTTNNTYNIIYRTHHDGYAQFSPDRTKYAILSDKKTGLIELHDFTNSSYNSFQPMHHTPTHPTSTDETIFLNFSPDSKMLASLSYEDGTVNLWDTTTKKCLHTFQFPKHSSIIVFSPDSKKFVSHNMGRLSYNFSIWDTETGALLHECNNPNGQGNNDTIMSIKFSPNSKLLVSCSYAHTMKLWDTTTGNGLNLETKPYHSCDSYDTLAFSPDSTKLACMSWSDAANNLYHSIITLWDTSTGILYNKLELGIVNDAYKFPRTIAFSADGNTLISSNIQFPANISCVKLWDVNTGELLNTANNYSLWSKEALSLDGKTLVLLGDNTISLWSPKELVESAYKKELLTAQTENLLKFLSNYPDSKYLTLFTSNKENWESILPLPEMLPTELTSSELAPTKLVLPEPVSNTTPTSQQIPTQQILPISHSTSTSTTTISVTQKPTSQEETLEIEIQQAQADSVKKGQEIIVSDLLDHNITYKVIDKHIFINDQELEQETYYLLHYDPKNGTIKPVIKKQ